MESAIPDHLRCPRTRHRRIPDDYAPPYPAAVARYKPDVKQVVMAYFGVQYLSESLPNAVDKALKSIASAFGSDKGPGHWDRALYVDEGDFTNIISIGYWDAPAEFDAWFGSYGASWTDTAVAEVRGGIFIEILRPTNIPNALKPCSRQMFQKAWPVWPKALATWCKNTPTGEVHGTAFRCRRRMIWSQWVRGG